MLAFRSRSLWLIDASAAALFADLVTAEELLAACKTLASNLPDSSSAERSRGRLLTASDFPGAFARDRAASVFWERPTRLADARLHDRHIYQLAHECCAFTPLLTAAPRRAQTHREAADQP